MVARGIVQAARDHDRHLPDSRHLAETDRMAVCPAGRDDDAGARISALKTPQYSASAELLIEPRGLQIVGNDILARDNGDALQRLAVDSQTYVILPRRFWRTSSSAST
ncbi:MAG: hypothetical protein HPM95_04960 [Alphaproteobacteria bacterium]|nr:hypothetical protein [Alphaproteobacteria bacterium]